jgi:hypothetical protein
MSFVHRSFAALSGLFLLQFLLLGSGTLCAMQHGTLHQSASRHAMQMTGTAHQTNSHETIVTSADSDGPVSPADASNSDDCQVPIVPGQCASMSACNTSATPSETLTASLPEPTVGVVLPTPVRAHSGPTYAPELPPPRV